MHNNMPKFNGKTPQNLRKNELSTGYVPGCSQWKATEEMTWRCISTDWHPGTLAGIQALRMMHTRNRILPCHHVMLVLVGKCRLLVSRVVSFAKSIKT